MYFEFYSDNGLTEEEKKMFSKYQITSTIQPMWKDSDNSNIWLNEQCHKLSSKIEIMEYHAMWLNMLYWTT